MFQSSLDQWQELGEGAVKAASKIISEITQSTFVGLSSCQFSSAGVLI